MSTATSALMTGNIVSRNDSDFSNGTAGTWSALANAGTPVYSTSEAVTGSGSLKWTATAAGDTKVETGFYPVEPSKPYVVSAVIMPAGPRDCLIGIAWYTSGGTLIETDMGADCPSSSAEWQPVYGSLTSPSNAAKCKVVALVEAASASDVNYVDLIYVAQADAQVLIDWTNGTASSSSVAGSDFVDVSPWVRMDQGITLMRGRQDSVSEIQAGSGSFSLQNDLGYFTRYKSTSLVSVLGGDATLQRRCQINLADENGVWYTRADGPISQLTYTFDATGKTNVVQISTTDVFAALNRGDSLSCWTREQVLLNGPILHWALNDSGVEGGVGVAAETSGSNGPSLRVRNTDKTFNATIAWNDTTGGVETLADAISPASTVDGSEYWSPGTNQPNSLLRGLDPGVVGPVTTPLSNVTFKPTLTAQTAANRFVGNTGYSLRTALPDEFIVEPSATSVDYSFEVFFTVDPYIAAHNSASYNYGPYCVLTLADSGTGVNLIAYVGTTNTTDHLNFTIGLFNQPPSFTAANFSANTVPSPSKSITLGYQPDNTDPVPHHLVLQITGDPTAPNVNGWLDGNQIDDTGTGFNLSQGQSFDTLIVGADSGGYGTHYGSFTCVSVYDYLLTVDQITEDCRLGQYGMWEATTDDCIGRLASYAAIPAYWNSLRETHHGCSLTEYYDITGSAALSAMEIFEQAEQGLLFADASGLLRFHSRDWRMGYGAPDLLLPPDTFNPDMGYEVVDQFMVNEQGISSSINASGTGYINQASQDEYGIYAVSSAASPTSLPIISWCRAFIQLGLSAFDFWAKPNMTDFAAFAANARSDPWMLPGTLTIDLQTLSKESTGVGISDLYALEIDSMIAPSGDLPDSFPDENASYEWFIEGIGETKTEKSRTIQFYTSPAEAQRCWIPGDTTYGVLGTTTRLGVSATDTSVCEADGKDVAHDGGGPFWPPDFTDAALNNPSGDGHLFVGANDIRGLTDTMRRMVKPPMWVVGSSTTQAFASGQLTSPQVFWDSIYVDSEGGFGIAPGWPNWYVVTVPGYYDLDAYVQWHALNVSGTVAQAYFVIAQAAAQRLAAGSATPTTNGFYVCPVGSQVPTVSGSTSFPGNNLSTRIYLGLGDMVTVAAEQSTGSSQNLGSQYNGSMFSGVWRGFAVSDDQVQINSTITGGTISTGGGQGGDTAGSPPANQTGSRGTTYVTATKSYSNTHTYSYYGAAHSYQRVNTDGTCYQGTPQGKSSVTGAYTSQIVWPYSTIVSDLTGATVTQVKLTATNSNTWYNTGCRMLLGWATTSPGGATWSPHTGGGHRAVLNIGWGKHQEKTVYLPTSWATNFLLGGGEAAEYFTLGIWDDNNLNDYCEWDGGPGAWTLEVTYRKAV